MTCPNCGRAVTPADPECPLCGEELLWESTPNQPTVRLAAVDPPSRPAHDPSSRPTEQFPAIQYPPAANPPAGYPTTSYPPPGPPPPDRNPAVIPILIIIAVLVVALIAAGFVLTRGQGSQPTAAPSPAATTGPANPATVPLIPATPATTAPTTPAAGGNLSQEAQASADTTAPDGKDSDGQSVSYAAANVVDGDPSTAWRTKGDASGQSLTLAFPRPVTISEVGLINGYAKDDPKTSTNRYPQERRITRVQWEFDNGTDVNQTLRDGDESPQTMAITPVTTNSVKVTIESTTSPGDSSFDYTAISEIEVQGTGSQ